MENAFTVQDIEDWDDIVFIVEPEEQQDPPVDLEALQQCLDAADVIYDSASALCELNQNAAVDFICRTGALLERVLNSLECISTYVPQEPPSGDVVSVFVTSGKFAGNLGGLAGADQKCQDAAVAAGLAGTWTAWLSDSTENAIDRIPDGQYQLLNGTQVANDKADLTDGRLKATINLDELGQEWPVGFAWTGTQENGTNTGINCNNWTDPPENSVGDYGVIIVTNEQWTLVPNFPPECTDTYRLYCFGEGVE